MKLLLLADKDYINKRILTRKDHNITTYVGFVYLGCLINNLKILEIINKKL